MSGSPCSFSRPSAEGNRNITEGSEIFGFHSLGPPLGPKDAPEWGPSL